MTCRTEAYQAYAATWQCHGACADTKQGLEKFLPAVHVTLQDEKRAASVSQMAQDDG